MKRNFRLNIEKIYISKSTSGTFKPRDKNWPIEVQSCVDRWFRWFFLSLDSTLHNRLYCLLSHTFTLLRGESLLPDRNTTSSSRLYKVSFRSFVLKPRQSMLGPHLVPFLFPIFCCPREAKDPFKQKLKAASGAYTSPVSHCFLFVTHHMSVTK